MRALQYRGIIDMGYRFDARDGKYKVYDINPRVGATFRLFVDTLGYDVVRAFYLDMTHQGVSPGQIREGRRWIVEDSDLLSSFRYRSDRQLSVRNWIRSLRGIEEGALFAVDDMMPLGARMTDHCRKLFGMRRGTPTPPNQTCAAPQEITLQPESPQEYARHADGDTF
jgi:predicted ATP-grasp superfamily ATP-dependent carboligase